MASQYVLSNRMLPMSDEILHEMTLSFQNSILQQQQFLPGGGGPGNPRNRLFKIEIVLCQCPSEFYVKL